MSKRLRTTSLKISQWVLCVAVAWFGIYRYWLLATQPQPDADYQLGDQSLSTQFTTFVAQLDQCCQPVDLPIEGRLSTQTGRWNN